MRRYILLSQLMIISLFSLGQVEDRTETNCDGESRSIYQVGMEGKPLIVAAKGLDCSICMSQAPLVRSFSDQYVGQIEVWGAMQNLYNPDDPTCDGVADWEVDYNWTNIFTFLDIEEYWRDGAGLPDYHVIHPVTHEAVYVGTSWTSASNAALELLASGITPIDNGIDQLIASVKNETLEVWLDGGLPGLVNIEIINTIGQRVAEIQTTIGSGPQNLTFPFGYGRGVYILRMSQNGQSTVCKFTAGS